VRSRADVRPNLQDLLRAKTPTDFVRDVKPIIERVLEGLLGQLPAFPYAKQIPIIAKYAVFAGGGGKRVRPALALLTARCLNTPLGEVVDAAAALELVHSYTLIIDDIQDGDETRRNEPTAHVKFGTELSLLAAGVLLLEGTTRLQELLKVSPATIREVLYKLHAGQEADIESSTWEASERTDEAINFMFAGKTGALFELACLSGIGTTRVDERTIGNLLTLGREMGVLFQAVDDYLEQAGNDIQTGKPVGKSRAGKVTFMSLFQDKCAAKIEIARRREALEAKIDETLVGEGAEFFKEFLGALVDRTR
jgi:geranylgeranyl pyrophosphate synthase